MSEGGGTNRNISLRPILGARATAARGAAIVAVWNGYLKLLIEIGEYQIKLSAEMEIFSYRRIFDAIDY